MTLATVDVSRVLKIADRQLWARIVDDIADAAVIRWDQWVVTSMSPVSAKAYRAGISKVEPAEGIVVLTLAGTFPLMLERGWHYPEGINLRVTLLRPGAPGVKTAKDGHRYRRIMFRHGTQGGKGAGYAGEDVGGAEQRVLGWSAQQGAARAAYIGTFARRLRPSYGGGKYGRSPKGSTAATAPKWLQAGLVSKLRERHVTDIYAGLRRMGKKAGGGMSTFRTISSNPNSKRGDAGGDNWHHPGIRGRRLVPKVRNYVRGIMPNMIFYALQKARRSSS